MAEITLYELNALSKNPTLTISESEKEYHERIESVSQTIEKNENIRIVLLAGPSGSGKTTTANLIADAVRKRGEAALVVSLDDFYRSSDDPDYPKLTNGELDYECPEALDLPLLSETLGLIAEGKPFSIPKYDFKVGARVGKRAAFTEWSGCVIIEGLHALNPKISEGLPKERIIKLFVSVSTNINDRDGRILSGRKLRFVRRLVRDSIYRGTGAERTLSMWKKVLSAEDVYLYPYKETADLAFNTFHAFEPGVMRGFALPLIPKSLCDGDPYAREVRSALERIEGIDHKLVPENSLIREFIPGGIYEALY